MSIIIGLILLCSVNYNNVTVNKDYLKMYMFFKFYSEE